MTVAELIALLQRQPQQLPVKVLLSEILPSGSPFYVDLQRSDALPARTVTNAGNYVLIESE